VGNWSKDLAIMPKESNKAVQKNIILGILLYFLVIL
jgi:hypothetical protein